VVPQSFGHALHSFFEAWAYVGFDKHKKVTPAPISRSFGRRSSLTCNFSVRLRCLEPKKATSCNFLTSERISSAMVSWLRREAQSMALTKVQEVEPSPLAEQEPARPWKVRRFLTFGPLCLAGIQAVCAAAVALSGIRTVLGFSSLIAATAAGPATGFHANKFRIPMLALAGVGAVVNLMLFWNAERLRRNPSARWRMRVLTRKETIGKWIQVGSSVLTLLLIVAEVLTHPLFHHEM